MELRTIFDVSSRNIGIGIELDSIWDTIENNPGLVIVEIRNGLKTTRDLWEFLLASLNYTIIHLKQNWVKRGRPGRNCSRNRS